MGGLSERYGTPTMLYSFELLNRTGVYPLILVCRKEELSEIDPKYLDAPWLKIAHAEGAELEKYYGIADIGVFFGKRDLYMDFAMPVKVFEYLSYGLPVITTNCAEISSFVSRNKVGVTVNDDFRAIVSGIKEFLSKPKSYYTCYKNVIRTVENGNLWLDRAQKVITDLNDIKHRRGK